MLFEREDWKLFRNIETLPQKAGVSRDKLGMLVAKELVDNALDICGSCEIGFEEKFFYSRIGLSISTPDLHYFPCERMFLSLNA